MTGHFLAGGAAATGATSGSTTSAVTATPVTLGDVATVKIAPAPLTAVTRTNGKSSIGISVSKSSSGNTVDIANAIADELPSITKDLGGQATVHITVTNTDPTYKAYNISLQDLIGANPQIQNVNVIWEGMPVNIPPIGWHAPAATPTHLVPVAPSAT